MTHHVLIAAALLCAMTPAAAAAGQATVGRVSVEGAIGTHINGGGDSESLAVGFSLGRRIDLLVRAERLHVPTAVTRDDNGFGATRGGTTTFVGGEVRVVVSPSTRFLPYVVAGAGTGVSRPNVNEIFVDPVTNDAVLFFGGGGLRVPATEHLSVFAEVRAVLQFERGHDSLFLFAPVRGGLAWRF